MYRKATPWGPAMGALAPLLMVSVIVLSVEQSDDPDIDAARAIAGPLVESVEPAP